jgi:serine protease Do
MKHFSRLYFRLHFLGYATLLAAGAVLAIAPPASRCQAGTGGRESAPVASNATPQNTPTQNTTTQDTTSQDTTAQGYLGVDLTDVDGKRAKALKLKEPRGALITLIDHDAPAGQIGLRVNDVVLGLDSEAVENADQLRTMLHAIPPGRTVSIEISREGNLQTLSVEMADRKVIEQNAWDRIGNSEDDDMSETEMDRPSSDRKGQPSGGFHFPFFGGSLNVGALVEPLTSQMAEFLGIHGGLIVRQVAHKSEAAIAGLRAFDVILKVGPNSIATLGDWGRALRSNEGKPVQVTILRDKKEQIVTLKIDSRRSSAINRMGLFPEDDSEQMAARMPADRQVDIDPRKRQTDV